MSRVRAKDTKVEYAIRGLVHKLGYRYRLHANDLPGKPDLVFRSRRKVIFVYGCFWHRHRKCKLARLPKSRLRFWLPKLEGNRLRDKVVQRRLTKLGWLLRQVGMVMLYYHLFRVAKNDDWAGEITRKKLVDFDKLLEKNRTAAEQGSSKKVDLDLLEFDRYAQSPNDGSAIRFRLRVILDRVFNKKIKEDEL